MDSPKIGFAISLYDKFDELKILVDIIRKNWKDKYFISVCSNKPGAEEHLKKLDIDTYIIGDDIRFEKDMNEIQRKINKQCRVFDCVRKSCSGANKLGCDYVMHLHTDAWPLKEEGVKRLVQELERNKKKIAIRGMGFTRYRPSCPLGHLDDMFFVYNVKFAEKVELFKVNPLALLPGRQTIHGMLSTLVLGKINLDKVYHYDDYTKNVYWDNTLSEVEFRPVIPTMFDYKYNFLHIHRGGLPETFPENLQAMYLYDYGITEGEHIKAFLKEFLVDKEKLFKNIKKAEEKINRQLQKNGFLNPKWGRFGRDASRKQWYLNLPFKRKLGYWSISMAQNFWEGTFKKYLGVEIVPDHNLWPESLDSFYTRNLNPSDYPEGMVWYQQKVDKKQKNQPIYSGFKVFW